MVPMVPLYTSPRPKLILAASRLLALKSLVSGVSSGYYIQTLPTLSSTLSLLTLLESPQCKLALGFGVLSLLSGVLSHGIVTRTVVKLEVEDGVISAPGNSSATISSSTTTNSSSTTISSSSPTPTLVVSAPNLLGSGERVVGRYPLSSVTGAPPGSTLQSFRVPLGLGVMLKSYYLFPVEPLWRSGDLPTLRRLLYREYFREGEARAAIAAGDTFAASHPALTQGIAGFGPFRPALYADQKARSGGVGGLLLGAKTGADNKRVGDGRGEGDAAGVVVEQPKKHTLPPGLRMEKGEVWADFVVPPPLTLEERRAVERERSKVIRGGGEKGKVHIHHPLPTLPTSLQ